MCWRRATSRDFSFGGNSTPATVGPGSYNTETYFRNSKSARSPSPCFKTIEDRNIFSITSIKTPSPGDYNTLTHSTRLACSSSFQSRSKREVFNTSDNPSPCDHGEIKNWDKRPSSVKSSLTRFYHERPISGNVGQDVLGYEINEDGTVHNAVKKMHHGSEWVGPGSYSPESARSSRYHSLNEKYRNCELWAENSNPGPGQYSPDNPDQRYLRKISTRPSANTIESPKSEGLGPTTWAPGTKRSQTSMFKSRTQRKLYGDVEETPSPVAYQSRPKSANSSSLPATHDRHIGFGQRSPRFEKQNYEGPGPGQYETKQISWGKKGGSLVRRAVDKSKPDNENPGPGSYRPSQEDSFRIRDSRPTSGFASLSKRGWDDSNENPGPGTYYAKGYNHPKKKKTIHASRFKETNNFMYNPYQDNPSPADYQQIERPRSRGRSIPRSDRFERQARSDTPGPGSYEIVHSSFIKKSNHIDFRGLR